MAPEFVSPTSCHDVAAIARAGRENARHHIDIVIRAGTGPIDREKDLPDQAFGIDRFTDRDVATEVYLRAQIKGGCGGRIFGIG